MILSSVHPAAHLFSRQRLPLSRRLPFSRRLLFSRRLPFSRQLPFSLRLPRSPSPRRTLRFRLSCDFVTAKFSNSKYVDGNISGYLTLDLDKAYKACVDDRNKCSSYKFSDYFRYFNESFSEKSAKDTVEAKFNVIKDARDIKELEGLIGVRFDAEEVVKVKLADEIKAQNIDVLTPVDIDFYKYIDENYYTTGISPDKVYINLKDGEFKEGDYKLKLEGFQGSEWDTSGEFTISKDDTVLATVYVYSESSSAKDKSQVNITLSYSSDYNDDTLIYDTAIRVASKSKKYDVTAQKGVTLDEAKKNIDTLIKKTEKDNKSSSYNIDVVSSYLLTAKDKDEENQNLIINIYCQTYKKDSKYKYYYTDGFKNCYIDTYETDKESQFKFEDDYSSWSSSSSENEALRDIKTDYQKDYTIQKIK